MALLTTVLVALRRVTAAAAGLFWYFSGIRLLRRVSRFEVLENLDPHRIVIAFDRAFILNRQATKAAALALRFGVTLSARV